MGLAMESREQDYVTFTRGADPDYGLENALAAYVRRRGLSIKEIALEWGLTHAEARGVLYGTAGRGTIRKILKHKRGGWGVGLIMMTGAIGHDLETHIGKERERERKSWEAMDRGLGRLAGSLRAFAGDPPGADL